MSCDDVNSENIRLKRTIMFLKNKIEQLEKDQKEMEINYRKVVPEKNEILMHQMTYLQKRVYELEHLVKKVKIYDV